MKKLSLAIQISQKRDFLSAIFSAFLSEVVSISVSDELMDKLDRAVISVRREYPGMEGVKSNLIRASIMQRLIRDATSVTE